MIEFKIKFNTQRKKPYRVSCSWPTYTWTLFSSKQEAFELMENKLAEYKLEKL